MSGSVARSSVNKYDIFHVASDATVMLRPVVLNHQHVSSQPCQL